MKLDLGSIANREQTKVAQIQVQSRFPEIFGIIVGVITTLALRHSYKTGNEHCMNAELAAQAEVGVTTYDPKKPIKAKVLK